MTTVLIVDDEIVLGNLLAEALEELPDCRVLLARNGEVAKPILLSDTVGFVSDLPHQLVASFKATLEEAVNADLLLHVVDVDKLAYRMIPDFQIEMVRENAGKAGQHVLDSKVAILEEAGFSVDARLDFGPPRQSICKIANDEAFQLMIIGRRESTGEIRDVLFGSVANYVLHNVACPVLLF